MTKARILIAEDDPNFALVLASYLRLHHYEVVHCDDGNKALSALQSGPFDLCILDVMMPHRDGFAVAESLQRAGLQLPVVFLTAKALKADQLRGYQLGAIDYLVKPFDPDILLLKVQAILGRWQTGQASSPVYAIGPFAFDPNLRRLSLANAEDWKLSPKAAELLCLLCEKQGELLSREEALLKIWQEDSFFTAQSMNVYITKLRQYFRTDPTRQVEIENLHGKGFVLRVRE